MYSLQVSLSSQCFSAKNTGLGTDIYIKLEYITRSLVKIKSIPDWQLFISRTETKWTKWYAMTSHVIAYRSLELLFGTHTFHFNCFFEDFNCVFTQIRCLSRVLNMFKTYLLFSIHQRTCRISHTSAYVGAICRVTLSLRPVGA